VAKGWRRGGEGVAKGGLRGEAPLADAGQGAGRGRAGERRRGGRRKATRARLRRVGYTFEYINVCNIEFVLEWASAILSGGY
jgi:hypothetical protein